MNVATIATTEPKWWYQDGATGTVDPSLLAPDPYQPRRFFVDSELKELAVSAKFAGIRERLVISPRELMPWIPSLGAKYNRCRFIISSGHRRQLAAMMAELKEVPVEIKVYKNESEHREDAAIRNAQRAPLSALEEAFEIKRRHELGERMEDIGNSFGKSKNWAQLRLTLTRLDPEIQARLNPELGKEVLPTAVAQQLGGVATPESEDLDRFMDEHGLSLEVTDDGEDARRFTYQRALLTVIEKEGMNANLAREFITGSKHEHGAMHRHYERRGPAKSSAMLEQYFRHVITHNVTVWDLATIKHALKHLDVSKAEQVLQNAEAASAKLENLISVIRKAVGEKKQRTNYTTPTMVTSYAGSASAAARPAKVQPRPSPVKQAAPPLPEKKFIPVVATYYDEKVGRYVTDEISDAGKYIRLWKEKGFKWQDRDERKPDYLPTLEEVEACLA